MAHPSSDVPRLRFSTHKNHRKGQAGAFILRQTTPRNLILRLKMAGRLTQRRQGTDSRNQDGRRGGTGGQGASDAAALTATRQSSGAQHHGHCRDFPLSLQRQDVIRAVGQSPEARSNPAASQVPWGKGIPQVSSALIGTQSSSLEL